MSCPSHNVTGRNIGGQRCRRDSFRQCQQRQSMVVVTLTIGMMVLLLDSVVWDVACWTPPSWPTLSFPKTATPVLPKSYVNSDDPAYPHQFTGRAILRPALVRVPTTIPLSETDDNNKNAQKHGLQVLSLFGWTLGGTVALEYDDSPVGYYREYVNLGGLALYKRNVPKAAGSNSKIRVVIGQFGSSLCVNEPQAETLCQQVWDLSAEAAKITIKDENEQNPGTVSFQDTGIGSVDRSIMITGWSNLRDDKEQQSTIPSRLTLPPLLWTPKIKAIWSQLYPLPFGKDETSRTSIDDDWDSNKDDVPLHRLRVSGRPTLALADLSSSSVSLPDTMIPLGIDVILRDLLIEISPRMD